MKIPLRRRLIVHGIIQATHGPTCWNRDLKNFASPRPEPLRTALLWALVFAGVLLLWFFVLDAGIVWRTGGNLTDVF